MEKATVFITSSFLLFCLSEGCLKQETFTALDLAPDYWQPLNSSEEVSYSSFELCSFGCLGNQACMAFVFDEVRKTCSLGTIVPAVDNNYVPSYVMHKKTVFIRKGLISRKVLQNVTHIGFMPHSAVDYADSAFEDTRFRPIAMPDPPVIPPYFAVNSYQEGILVCGGLEGSTVDKKCRLDRTVLTSILKLLAKFITFNPLC